jgi:hypothetical protein
LHRLFGLGDDEDRSDTHTTSDDASDTDDGLNEDWGDDEP